MAREYRAAKANERALGSIQGSLERRVRLEGEGERDRKTCISEGLG